MKYIIFLFLFVINTLNAQIEVSTNSVLFYQYSANECIFKVTETKHIKNHFKIYKEKLSIISKGKLFKYIIVKDYLNDYIDKKVWFTEHNEKIIYYINKDVLILYYNYNKNTYRYDNYIIFYN